MLEDHIGTIDPTYIETNTPWTGWGDINCCEGYPATYSGQQKGVLYFILQMKNLSEGTLFCMLFGSVLSKSVSCSGDFSTVAARIRILEVLRLNVVPHS